MVALAAVPCRNETEYETAGIKANWNVEQM